MSTPITMSEYLHCLKCLRSKLGFRETGNRRKLLDLAMLKANDNLLRYASAPEPKPDELLDEANHLAECVSAICTYIQQSEVPPRVGFSVTYSVSDSSQQIGKIAETRLAKA